MSTRFLPLLLMLLALLLAAGPALVRAETAAPAGPAVAVDAEIWNTFESVAGDEASFVVVMHERIAGEPASTISAQLALEPVLDALRMAGQVSSHASRYGANEIQITGSRAAVHFLAAWPEVAAIRTATGRQAQATLAAAGTAHITGSVSGPAGALSSIEVRAYRQVSPIDWEVAGTAATAASGAYDIGGLAAGVYVVRFRDAAGGYVTEYYDDRPNFDTATRFNLADAQLLTGINATLALAGKITGTVTASGSGVSDILATASINVGGVWQSNGSASSLTSGAYTIGGLGPGTYRVEFRDLFLRYVTEWWDNAPTRELATGILVSPGATSAGKNAILGGAGSISGKITGPDGASPIANIDVRAWQWNATYSYWEQITAAATAANGTYNLGLLGGTYRLGFTDPLNPPYMVTEYFDDKADFNAGSNVAVSANGSPTTGIDASLALHALPPAPAVTLAPSGSNAYLAWDAILEDVAGKPVTIQRYEVWYSAAPYFSIGEALATRMDRSATNYTDTNALITSGGRFYLVRALTDRGGYSPASKKTAKFVFPLTRATQ